MNDRCRAWKEHNGEILTCEDKQGHTSAHYNGDVWWPNRRGLPDMSKPNNSYMVVGWLVAGVVLTVIIVWLVLLR
jgi:hypothetical protein